MYFGSRNYRSNCFQFEDFGCQSVRLYSPIALQPKEAHILHGSRTTNRSSFRITSCGRLIHWKGFDLGISAFLRVQKELPNSEYVIIGDGPERGDLEQLAARLGIASKVRFLGTLPQEAVFAEFKKTDCCCIPVFMIRMDGSVSRPWLRAAQWCVWTGQDRACWWATTRG